MSKDRPRPPSSPEDLAPHRREESFWADAERHMLRRGTFDHLPEEGA